jgi:hypothetical protein
MANCVSCGTKKPFLETTPWSQVEGEVFCPDCTRKRDSNLRTTIQVLTGDFPGPYDVIDSIFALDSTTASIFQGINPNDAFEGVKQQLRHRCMKLGGDAVVNCQFQYRNALADGIIGKNQSLEIFAYGTAIRRRSS